LLESLVAAAIGLTALFVILHRNTAKPGALFVASFAAYTLCRQFLLPLRAERRKSSIGATLTAAVAASILAADIVVLALGVRLP